MKQTPLYSYHVARQAHMVEFAGWAMPMHYGSQIQEHLAARRHIGLFDVSHMMITDIRGTASKAYLRHLLSNDVAKIKPGQALYSCLLHHEGGVLDDLIVYQLQNDYYRLITNASTRDKVSLWLAKVAQNFQVTLSPQSAYALIAVQGPQAIRVVSQHLAPNARASLIALKPFTMMETESLFIARTGYTGEPGVEVLLSADNAVAFWKKLLEEGAVPCGLGARDTLRQEAGLNLYGQEMDEQSNPYESNLGFTIDLKDGARDFIGKNAVLQMQATKSHQLVGLVAEKHQLMRRGAKVIVSGQQEGVVTSGTYAPSLDCAIAFARIPISTEDTAQAAVRGQYVSARIVSLPFIRQGRPTFSIKPVLQ